MTGKQSKGRRNRRTRRRPRDDRVRKIRVTYSETYAMSKVLNTGLQRVRDSRLQSIRVVGGNTDQIKVYLSGGFTNGEVVNLAVIQKTPLRLNRTLTCPRRVREYFLDSVADSQESYVTMYIEFKGIAPEYVEFTFLTESPPVLTYGLDACKIKLATSTSVPAGEELVDVTTDLPDNTTLEFEHSSVVYLGIYQKQYSAIKLFAPPVTAHVIPNATPLPFKLN